MVFTISQLLYTWRTSLNEVGNLQPSSNTFSKDETTFSSNVLLHRQGRHAFENRMVDLGLYWKLWSKIWWNVWGDEYSKFFFHSFKGKARFNRLKGVTGSDGHWVSDPSKLRGLTSLFFQVLLNKVEKHLDLTDNGSRKIYWLPLLGAILRGRCMVISTFHTRQSERCFI